MFDEIIKKMIKILHSFILHFLFLEVKKGKILHSN
jgi:hypothetical protein